MEDVRLEPLARGLAELTGALLGVRTAAEVLTRVTLAARRLIPGADLVSVTLRDVDGSFHTPIRDSPVAAQLDQLQYDLREGPCVDAARVGGPALAESADLGQDPSWPSFGPAAAALGFSSVLSTAILAEGPAGGDRGALNVFARSGHAMPPHAREIALLLATHAALALAHTRAVTRAELERAELWKAVESRDVIGQAKGILMARRGVSADEAFDLLRRTSQDLNVKLADVARTLAERHGELDAP